MEANRRLWEEWTEIHARSEMYDLEGFRAGRRRLHPLEIGELGDVSGKTMLHLQCHFGLDSLSWADRGAIVTGADFSEKAITLARVLSEELEIPARFVLSNLYDLPQALDETFDIVFTSYGVLTWLPDITRWAEVVAHFLRSGGTFYIAEIHPTSYIFDDGSEVTDLRGRYPYFTFGEPLSFPVEGSYADPTAHVNEPEEHAWPHTLGDIVTALLKAGLTIEYLREHPFTVYQQGQWLRPAGDGTWVLKDGLPSIPLLFSIKAQKPAASAGGDFRP
jgi:ubiquinone/menaquinone biosynthesis C-methylase UbiE